MASPFGDLEGAVLGDSAAPEHYGDLAREQRALAAGRAIVALGDRSVVEVSGPERLSWLDSITSQAVSRLEAGTSTELLILDPNGRVEHAASVFDDGVTAWLIVDIGDAAGLTAWLKRMVFRSQVTVTARDDLAVVGFEAGAEAEELVAAHAWAPQGVAVMWRDPWTHVTAGGHQYAATDAHPGAERPWVEAIVDEAGLTALAGAAGSEAIVAAGMLAAEARRVEAWRPRWARELDERSIPHELDWLRSAVHLNKGCYRGQETVAKVHNLGHPPRRLVFLHLDGALVTPGAAVRLGTADESTDPIGVVTSAAFHHELGPIALAVIKRSADPEAALQVQTDEGWLAAAQEMIVPPSAGAAASIPRLPRLSSRR